MRARAGTRDGRPVAAAVRRIQRADPQRFLASHVARTGLSRLDPDAGGTSRTTQRRDHGPSDCDSSGPAHLDALSPVNAGALAAHIAPRDTRPS
jgi:hypothetical protein